MDTHGNRLENSADFAFRGANCALSLLLLLDDELLEGDDLRWWTDIRHPLRALQALKTVPSLWK